MHYKRFLRSPFIACAKVDCVLLALFTSLGEMFIPHPFPRQLYFVYLAAFFSWVLCLTPNLGLIVEK